MKHAISEKISIPEGVTCEYKNGIFKCKKNSKELEKKINIPGITLRIENNTIFLEAQKGNKNQFKIIKSYISHIKNLFQGLEKNFVYKLESCNVHFPMTFKVEGNEFIINNFLGEKVPRKAKILPNVDVKIEGNKIYVSSNDIESAGQTAANIEKATRIKARDRRIFQDGIYITEKPQTEGSS